jgi:hypothetical protein
MGLTLHQKLENPLLPRQTGPLNEAPVGKPAVHHLPRYAQRMGNLATGRLATKQHAQRLGLRRMGPTTFLHLTIVNKCNSRSRQ